MSTKRKKTNMFGTKSWYNVGILKALLRLNILETKTRILLEYETKFICDQNYERY